MAKLLPKLANRSNRKDKYIKKQWLFFVLLCSTATSSDIFLKYNFSNKNFLYQTNTKQISYIYDYNRLRFNLNTGVDNFFEIKGIADLESLVGEDYLATNTVKTLKDQRLDLPINPYRKIYDEKNLLFRSYLYRLYAKLYILKGSYSFGLQRIPLGLGKIWNPTDIINPANPLSTEPSELTGAYGSLATYELNDISEVQWFQTLNLNNKQKETGGRLLLNVFRYDIELSVVSSDKIETNGLSIDGELLNTGMGIRTEIAYFTEKQRYYQYQKYLIGLDYTFSNSLYLILEGFVNSRGETKVKTPIQNTLESWHSRYYLGATISYPITSLTTISLNHINNLNDGSFFTSPLISRSLADNTDISIGASIFGGEPYREFWYHENMGYINLGLYF